MIQRHAISLRKAGRRSRETADTTATGSVLYHALPNACGVSCRAQAWKCFILCWVRNSPQKPGSPVSVTSRISATLFQYATHRMPFKQTVQGKNGTEWPSIPPCAAAGMRNRTTRSWQRVPQGQPATGERPGSWSRPALAEQPLPGRRSPGWTAPYPATAPGTRWPGRRAGLWRRPRHGCSAGLFAWAESPRRPAREKPWRA